ncbi:class I SAM-dependent methyltransferase [Gangjinia marincola]|uniref:Class I SAM-dependent methyltransferase n=1 Tax=Gangjinia marincola TaxID=578463 RepID=A0ABN1MII0_9FLAO
MKESSQNPPYLNVTDHSVTGEKFSLVEDDTYDILKTIPQPYITDLPKYYKSEDYISHTDARRTIFERLYGGVKNLMLNRKIKLVNSYAPMKANILDIGAGTGSFVASVIQKRPMWTVHGIEPNKDARILATKKGATLNTDSGTFKDNFFDVITMWHVLEHVPDLEKQIRELDRILKKDGVLFIAVPNFKSYDANYYKEFWAAYDVPRHLWHFSANGITQLFNKHGFELTDTKPMKFDAFYVALLSEKYISGKMNYIKAGLVGFRSNAHASKTGEYSSLIYIFKRIKPNNAI